MKVEHLKLLSKLNNTEKKVTLEKVRLSVDCFKTTWTVTLPYLISINDVSLEKKGKKGIKMAIFKKMTGITRGGVG